MHWRHQTPLAVRPVAPTVTKVWIALAISLAALWAAAALLA
jgi:hypothetical protein